LKIKFLIFSLLFLLFFPPAKAAVSADFPSGTTVLQAGISETQDLPPGLYGEWKVQGFLIESNNPLIFNQASSDIWIFEKNGKVITLTNPLTNAQASITVNEIKQNSATFTRKEFINNKKEAEQTTIELDGDKFYGTDLIVIQEFVGKTPSELKIAKYTIEGTRVSGSKTQEIFYDIKK